MFNETKDFDHDLCQLRGKLEKYEHDLCDNLK